MSLDILCPVLIGYAHYPVGIVGKIEISIPREILTSQDITVQSHLYTGIAHITHIVIYAGITGRHRVREEIKHIRGKTIEIFHRTGKSAAEELEIRSDIEIGIGLPGNGLVAKGIRRHSDLALIITDRPPLAISVRAYAVISLRADRGLQLEHVHPRSIEPYLLVQKPAGTERPEMAPPVLRTEIGRCIRTV